MQHLKFGSIVTIAAAMLPTGDLFEDLFPEHEEDIWIAIFLLTPLAAMVALRAFGLLRREYPLFILARIAFGIALLVFCCVGGILTILYLANKFG